MSHKPESDTNDPMVTWMRQLSNDPPERSHRPLPDPDLLWIKAQLLDRQAAREHSLKLVRWFESAARVLVAFAAYWLGSTLANAVVIPSLRSLSPTLLSMGVSIVLVTVTMLAFPIWSED
jgi:hypothetical protein